ncbi:hypothetical protein NQZ79_g253 [Umbelopsis isabellina]|nr:hypothetical protein NQZ79_g253 [Umbelopsis isabellina]
MPLSLGPQFLITLIRFVAESSTLIRVSSYSASASLNPSVDWPNIFASPSGIGPSHVFESVNGLFTPSLISNFNSENEASCNAQHTVVSGDTCISIASSKHTYFAQILALNPTINSACSNLVVGQSVCWRDSTEPTCITKSVVPFGASCSSMAASYGTTSAQILGLNPNLNSDCSNLYAGDIICVNATFSGTTTTAVSSTTAAASSTPSVACSKPYTVNAGDTCSSIGAASSISNGQLHPLTPLNPSVNAQPPCYKWYTAVSGNSCSSIQNAYKITTEQFKSCNPSLDCSSIVGKNVCISCATTNPVCTSIHRVVAGEWCQSLFSSVNMTFLNWRACNPGLNTCPKLKVGDHVCNQCQPRAPICTKFYQIASGDTLLSIAQKQGINTVQLLSINPGLTPTSMVVGNHICTFDASVPVCFKNAISVSGQDCTSFSASNNISLAQFHLYNRYVNANCSNFYTGDSFCVQGRASVMGQHGCAKTYTVQIGDTCFGMNAQIINAQCSDLQIGEVLCADNGRTPCNKRVMVKSGDSCSAIATAANISVNAVVHLNPFLDKRCTWIFPGDNLCVLSPLLADLTDLTPPAPVVPLLRAPFECVKNITLSNATSCLDLLLPNRLSSVDLQELNFGLNCTGLLPANTTVCVAKMPLGCTKTTLTTANQNCSAVAKAVSMPLDHFIAMNSRLNCAVPLPNATPVCISDPFSQCTSTKAIASGDSCSSLQAINGLALNDFQALNPTLNCSKLTIGTSACVLGRFSHCAQTYVTNVGATCSSVLSYSAFGTISQLQQANPWVNCSLPLMPSTRMCIRPSTAQGCILVAQVNSGDTCSSMATKYNITLFGLNATNPGLDCQNLMIDQQICVQPPSVTCSQFFFVTSNRTCSAIAASSNITMDQFNFYNPTYDCNNVVIGSVACTGIKPINMINLQLMSSIVPHAATLNSNIQTEYNAYLASSTGQNLNQLNKDLTAVLASSEGAALILSLNANNSYFSAYEDRNAKFRSLFCNQASRSATTTAAATCFCGSSSNPFLHCAALFHLELQQFVSSKQVGTST